MLLNSRAKDSYLGALVKPCTKVIAKVNDYLSSLDYCRCLGMLFETDADIADCVLGYIENQQLGMKRKY